MAVTPGGATGIQWGQTNAAVTYPAMPRTAPTTKNYRTQNVNSVGVEKPCSRKGRERTNLHTAGIHNTER